MNRRVASEWLVGLGKPLISLVPARSGLQHRIARKNEADTARNPYFMGLSVGDPSRSTIFLPSQTLGIC